MSNTSDRNWTRRKNSSDRVRPHNLVRSIQRCRVATDYVNNSCLSSMAKRKRAQDEYVIGVGKAELKSDQEPSTMEHARHLATRCKTIVLTDRNGPLGTSKPHRTRTATSPTSTTDKKRTRMTSEQLTNSWVSWARHSAWIVNQFQIQSDGRTAHRNMRDKEYDKELVKFAEFRLFRNHDADEKMLEERWNT